MGKPAAKRAAKEKEPHYGLGFWCFVLWVKIPIYLSFCFLCQVRNLWTFSIEPIGLLCNHPPKPPKQTGVKALVYGLPKTGTTNMYRHLNLLMKTWHTEEFKMHVWSPMVDDYFSKLENGGNFYPRFRVATPDPPAYKGHTFWPRHQRAADMIVFNNTPTEKLVEHIGRCAPDAMTFEGMEEFFWPVYHASPNAKVIMLNWRTYQDLVQSKTTLDPQKIAIQVAIEAITGSIHMLPYNSLVLAYWDSHTERRLWKWMQDGGVMQTKVPNPLFLLYKYALNEHRIRQHWYSGLGVQYDPKSEKEYEAYWAEAKKIVPKKRLFEFDYKKHTMADLCKFLGIKDSPHCKLGELTDKYPKVAVHEQEFPNDLLFLLPLFWVLHYWNFKFFWWAVGRIFALLICRPCRRACCRKGESPQKSKSA